MQISKFSEEPFIRIFILLIILPKTTFWGDSEQDASTCLKKFEFQHSDRRNFLILSDGTETT